MTRTPETFRPEPDTAENRARLAAQRARVRLALTTAACPICKRARAICEDHA